MSETTTFRPTIQSFRDDFGILWELRNGATVLFTTNDLTIAREAFMAIKAAGCLTEDDALQVLYYAEDEGPTCGICDGLGHGYPGAGPCPLEEADYSGEPWWAL